MAPGLQKASVTIPLGYGIETDVDDKLLPLGKVLELENAVRGRTGEIVKRFGTNALSGTLVATGSIPQPFAMATHRGGLVALGVPGGNPLVEWSPARARWAPASSSRRGPMSFARRQVASAAMSMDVAYASGYYFVLYRDTQPGSTTLWQVAIDATTGARVFSRSVAGGGIGNGHRVGVVNGYAVYVYMNGGNVTMDCFQIASLDGTPTRTRTAAGVSTNKQLDVRVQGTLLQVCYTSGGNVAALDLDPSAGTVTAWSPRDAAGVAIAATTVMTWVLDLGGSGKIALATEAGVYWNFPTVGATRNAASVAATGFGANQQAITAYTSDSSAAGNGVVLYDDSSAVTIFAVGFTNGLVSAGPALVARSVWLASKAWKYGSDIFVAVAHPTVGQYTRYILNPPPAPLSFPATPMAPAPLANVAVQSGTNSGTGLNVLPSVPSPSANAFAFGLDIARSFEAARAVGSPISGDGIGVDLVTVTHGTLPNTTLGPPREAIDGLFVPGAALGHFDGLLYGEAGFAYFPDQPALVGAGGGGMTAPATYWYRIVYRYMDGQGRIWRSAPSVPQSIVMGANTSVNLTIPTLRLTDRTVLIEVYRGGANDSTAYQYVTQVANSTSADTVAFSDLASDAQIANNEFLYTNGGVLQSDVISGVLFAAVWNNRLAVVPMDDPQSVWISNVFELGRGVRFSSVIVVDVKDQRGDLRALSVIDDKLVMWKDDGIYVLVGDGPNVLGQGLFGPAQLVAQGVGCSNPQAICDTDKGQMFKSNSTKAGFFLLNRGLDVDFAAGKDVQRYASETIVGAVMIPGQSQARMYTLSGRTLVYDLITGQWSTFTNQAADCATVWNGVPVYSAHGSLSVRVEDITGATYLEAGASYLYMVVTPWLNLAGLRGFERLYRIQGVGETAGAHDLSIALYFDYDNSTGPSATAASPGPLWDWEFRYSTKKTALKVRLTDAGLTNTAGPKISGIAVEYGIKRGIRPLPRANRAT